MNTDIEKILSHEILRIPSPYKKKYSKCRLCVCDNCKPMFISRGYITNLSFAIQLTLISGGDHRIPELIYLADRLSNQKIHKKTSAKSKSKS